MKTENYVKSTTANTAAKIHNGVDAAEETIIESVDTFSTRLASLESELRASGDRLLANAKELGDVAGKQLRGHPLAAFGVAFVAGIAVARLLRR